MYKHKIIESFLPYSKYDIFSVFIELLKCSTEIFIGHEDNFLDVFEKTDSVGMSDIKIPFNPVLISMDCNNFIHGAGRCTSKGMLITNFEEKDFVFVKILYSVLHKKFYVGPVYSRIFGNQIIHYAVHESVPEDIAKKETMTMKNDIMDVLVCLHIINCKNISLSTVTPDGMEKRNKKRIKHGKPPIEQYKILTIDPSKVSIKSSPSSGERLGLMPVHICRGHFKEYTESNPLFGKYNGKFWWQPHVRGDKENGKITKDYILKQ